ncbi:MAG: hypothetical protein Tp152SUR00d2C52646391_53 [Prokaryotic dsDNA virus sp.]|nr:MAG: hypothetical protein Tp152SUR00d2C52646391_53 [Prokaryotic dsDNA virus sp.]|tara:strand:+ start:779 stop:994 length:216 start_codon:yes stop_codon:yes gene_type:complete
MDYYYVAWAMYLLGIWINFVGWAKTHKYYCRYPKIINTVSFISWPLLSLIHFSIAILIAFLLLCKKVLKGV